MTARVLAQGACVGWKLFWKERKLRTRFPFLKQKLSPCSLLTTVIRLAPCLWRRACASRSSTTPFNHIAHTAETISPVQNWATHPAYLSSCMLHMLPRAFDFSFNIRPWSPPPGARSFIRRRFSCAWAFDAAPLPDHPSINQFVGAGRKVNTRDQHTPQKGLRKRSLGSRRTTGLGITHNTKSFENHGASVGIKTNQRSWKAI